MRATLSRRAFIKLAAHLLGLLGYPGASQITNPPRVAIPPRATAGAYGAGLYGQGLYGHGPSHEYHLMFPLIRKR